MEHIETIELASSQASITFSSIPQDYDDLVVLISARSDASKTNFVDNGINLIFNGSTANQTFILLRGNGSGAGSFSVNRRYINAGNSTANTFGNLSIYVSNYTSSNDKSISTDLVTENNGTDANQAIQASLWNDTSAITSIGFDLIEGPNFVTGSTFSLYGITAGGDGTVTTS